MFIVSSVENLTFEEDPPSEEAPMLIPAVVAFPSVPIIPLSDC